MFKKATMSFLASAMVSAFSPIAALADYVALPGGGRAEFTDRGRYGSSILIEEDCDSGIVCCVVIYTFDANGNLVSCYGRCSDRTTGQIIHPEMGGGECSLDL